MACLLQTFSSTTMSARLLPASFFLFILLFFVHFGKAQPCDPTVAPTNLQSTVVPGLGVLVEWDAIPGSQGVFLNGYFPTGFGFYRQVVGFELNQFKVPESKLGEGFHTWRVFAFCNLPPSVIATPYSTEAFFNIGEVIECSPAVDGDGNIYPTVQIGSMCWIAENLKSRHFINGDVIPMLVSDSAWNSTIESAFAFPNNDSSLTSVYGLLYNWFVVEDARAVCPTGWHVATDQDWQDLTSSVSGPSFGGALLKTPGNTTDGTGLWLAPNSFSNNVSGFTAQPAGIRNLFGVFAQYQRRAFYWTADAMDAEEAYYRQLTYLDSMIGRNTAQKRNGYSIRCVQD